jgi:hypothetical protein
MNTLKSESAPLGSCVGIGKRLLSKMLNAKVSGVGSELRLVVRSTEKDRLLPGINIWVKSLEPVARAYIDSAGRVAAHIAKGGAI